MESPAKAAWHDANPEVRTRLPQSMHERLDAVLKQRGQNLRDWIIAHMADDELARLPESQGGVKRLVPLGVADLAQQVLAERGNALHEAASRISDPILRASRRREVVNYLDAAAYFEDILEESRYRVHVIESQQRGVRVQESGVRKVRQLDEFADAEPQASSSAAADAFGAASTSNST